MCFNCALSPDTFKQTHREQPAYQKLFKAKDDEKLFTSFEINIMQEVKPKL